MGNRLRPAEGWLPLILLLAIVLVLTLAVVNADWVPEGPVVVVTGFVGLGFGIALARRPISWWLAWSLIIAYGLLVTIIWLGRLVPPLTDVLSGWGASSSHIRQRWALVIDRAGGWLTVALGEGRSDETILFAFGLGLLVWLLAAYVGWMTFRQRRLWPSLALLTLALALNSYYGQTVLWSIPVFVGLLVALVAVVHFADREAGWTRRQVDYSDEIRLDLLIYSGAIALALLFVATAVPAINLKAISDAVLNRPEVDQVEETMERVFAGVRQPSPEPPADESALEDESGQGTMPRTFLLGAPPELYETVVFTATVQGDSSRAKHWRGLSYDRYTGVGWAVSAETEMPIAAGENIPLPDVAATTSVTQSVIWVGGPAILRYTLGLPLQIDEPVTSLWRGREDLSRIEGQRSRYTATSRSSAASAAQLRGASLAEVPPALMARYTALPDSIPDRVHDLAQQIALESGQGATPYDQAKAIERFLRQYPYSLEVEPPPAGSDPVDFFLFELQSGYCDYYASAMVVMARSLGLPARLAAGYLAQSPSAEGLQTVVQINAHSWAEIYFAGYGWLEFEPTAAFPAEDTQPALPGEPGFTDSVEAFDAAPPPIPEPSSDNIAYLWLLLLIPLLVGGWWLWRRRSQQQRPPLDPAQWAYDRLQQRAVRLGQSVRPSQTPAEFGRAFLIHLDQLSRADGAQRLDLEPLKAEIAHLTTTYADRQYGRRKPPAGEVASNWRQIRRRLWLLNVLEDLRRWWPFSAAEGPRDPRK